MIRSIALASATALGIAGAAQAQSTPQLGSGEDGRLVVIAVAASLPLAQAR